jgi:hypothetical protein
VITTDQNELEKLQVRTQQPPQTACRTRQAASPCGCVPGQRLRDDLARPTDDGNCVLRVNFIHAENDESPDLWCTAITARVGVRLAPLP